MLSNAKKEFVESIVPCTLPENCFEICDDLDKLRVIGMCEWKPIYWF